MFKLYTSHDPMLVGHLRRALADQGIHCIVRNEFLIGGAGELPPNECWPELWVTDDRDTEPARRLLHALTQPAENVTPWTCPACTEAIEGQFSHCWKCGAERPEE